MITFQTLEIEDFKSIKKAALEYDSGVWEVVGVNNDSEFSSNGSGKALPNSEPVLTPQGFKQMGDLTLIDKVIGSDGKPHSILGIYPQGERDIYKVSFRDGTYNYCDSEHLWTLQRGWGTKSHDEVYSVNTMLGSKIYTEYYDKRYDKKYKTYKYSLKLGAPCEYGNDGNLPLNPYLLGLLLGDGCFRKCINFYNKHEHLVDTLGTLLPVGDSIGVKKWDQGAWRVSVVGGHTRNILRGLGLFDHLSIEKFIPDIYMNASLASRRAMVQGLIDTDGYMRDGILHEFSFSSPRLAEQFTELGRSIGMYLVKRSRKSGYRKAGVYHGCSTSYRVEQSSKDLKTLVNIEFSHREQATCIKVDTKDELFVTRFFNLTHNTSIMEAVQQALFNKTTSPTPIDDVSRKDPGNQQHTKGYKLSVTFTDGKDNYKVVNNRKDMIIRVYKNGEDQLYKSIPASLSMISDTLGMDFHTFKTLTFISHDTIVDLLDNFSSSGLMKVILNFSQIAEFDKRAKMEQKALNMQIGAMGSQIQTIKESLRILTGFTEIDTKPMNSKRVALAKRQTTLLDKLAGPTQALKDELKIFTKEYSSNRDDLRDLNHKFDNATCPTCGTLLNLDEQALETMMLQIEKLTELQGKRKEVVDSLGQKLKEEETTHHEAQAALTVEITNVSNQLTIAKTKNSMYRESVKKADEMKMRLTELTTRYDIITHELIVVKTALLIVKTGDIQKDRLSSFTAALNINLLKFMGFVSLDYIGIISEASKDSVAFKIHDTRFNQVVSVHSLSGGEKTRLRLVVLLAMLHTIKDLADISTNILVFDESLDTLDASAAQDLANLFAYLVNNDNKFIAMISHGAQLQDILFSGTLTAEKSEGITTLTKGVT